MKKGKKIKELDDWLKNTDSHVFDDKGEQKHKSFENVISIMILIVFH